jgi:MFS family permease
MGSDDKGTEYRKGGASAWFTLIVCSLLYVLCLMDRQVLSTVLEPLKKDLVLSDSEVGMLLSIVVISLALFAIPTGVLVDRWSRKKSIGVMAIIWSAATFMTALGQNLLGVIIPRSVVGIGESGFTTGAGAMITASFPDTMRSRAMAIFYMCSPIGIVLGSVLGGYLSANYGGWRVPFYIFAVPGILLGIMVFFVKDYKSVQPDESMGKGFWQNTVYLLKIPSLKWAYISTGLFTFVIYGILFWAAAFLMRAMQIKEDSAGLFVGGLAIMGVLGTLAGGVISDIWYKKNPGGRVLVGVIGAPLGAIAVVIGTWLVLSGQYVVGLILMGIYAFAMQLYIPGIMTAIQEVVHPGTKGLAQSMNVLILFAMAAPATAIVGAISDALGGGASGLGYGLMLLAPVALLTIPCLLKCASHYPRDMDKVKHMVLEADK